MHITYLPYRTPVGEVQQHRAVWDAGGEVYVNKNDGCRYAVWDSAQTPLSMGWEEDQVTQIDWIPRYYVLKERPWRQPPLPFAEADYWDAYTLWLDGKPVYIGDPC